MCLDLQQPPAHQSKDNALEEPVAATIELGATDKEAEPSLVVAHTASLQLVLHYCCCRHQIAGYASLSSLMEATKPVAREGLQLCTVEPCSKDEQFRHCHTALDDLR